MIPASFLSVRCERELCDLEANVLLTCGGCLGLAAGTLVRVYELSISLSAPRPRPRPRPAPATHERGHQQLLTAVRTDLPLLPLNRCFSVRIA